MQVKIATPVSTIFEKEPGAVPEILAHSHALELRDHSGAVDSILPRLFHFEASILERWSDSEVEKIAQAISANRLVLASFHLSSCYEKPPVVDGMFAPEGKKMSENEMIKNAHENKERLEEKLEAPVIMAVENNNYHPTGAYEIVTNPEFIGTLNEKLGFKILLDLAHVAVTAGNRGIAASDYLAGFDLGEVIQLHLSHPAQDGARWRDAHEELSEADWAAAKAAIGSCPQLEFVTVEYYKDAAKLVSMLKKLKEILV